MLSSACTRACTHRARSFQSHQGTSEHDIPQIQPTRLGRTGDLPAACPMHVIQLLPWHKTWSQQKATSPGPASAAEHPALTIIAMLQQFKHTPLPKLAQASCPTYTESA